ncbi:polysaccharide pyruvyl transferase family protein [Prevotella intermedia]|uniref:polysaccharide pyruvyl transferase family protein n=1 Tax=Prevotella intermedia TaxID=28131 RepID=UPI000BE72041|nr:polysaccharide pyruvyl transferase family protein [Prevotella intermedia]PDP81665.1 hypothetical protein CLI69_08320 [Prevotella intermedia]
MRYQILSIGKKLPTDFINIGDYIQGVASAQFLPHLDGFIDRELVSKYEGELSKVIMNGWYMHYPENWPPSKQILPLFVALHINSNFKEQLLSKESVKYLKRYEPIGCRDYYTVNMLKDKGIDAYFSGCMTLTLGYQYHSNTKNNKVFFVDPYFKEPSSFRDFLSNIVYLLKHWKAISSIAYRFEYYWHRGLFHRLVITSFYRQYIQLFSKEVLLNAEYVCQESRRYRKNFKTEEERFSEAQRLVKEYSQARYVVTSRIHCALPCLGVETPVLYIENVQQSETSSCRLDGIRDLFNIIENDNGFLHPLFPITLPISLDTKFTNKESWRKLASNLKDRCLKFVQSE